MKRSRVLGGIVLVSMWIATAPEADGQVCLGRAPFAVGRIHLRGSLASPSGGKLFAGEVGAGTANAGFGSVDVSRAVADESDVRTTSLELHGGQQIPSSSGAVQLCPIVGVGHISTIARFGFTAGDTSVVERLSGFLFDIGGAVGTRLSVTETLEILPSFALQYAAVRLTGSTNVLGVVRTSPTRMDSRGLATVSAGFLIDRRLTMTPFVILPFGTPGPQRYFGFSVTLSVGPQAR